MSAHWQVNRRHIGDSAPGRIFKAFVCLRLEQLQGSMQSVYWACPSWSLLFTYTRPQWKWPRRQRPGNDSASQTYFSPFPVQHSKPQLSHRNNQTRSTSMEVDLVWWSSTIIDISVKWGQHDDGTVVMRDEYFSYNSETLLEALAFPFFNTKHFSWKFSEAIQLLLWYFQSDNSFIPFSLFYLF